ADHVGLIGKIEVGLDGAGAKHHVEAVTTDLGHVSRHDGVARLRHAWSLGLRPFGREAGAEETDPEWRCAFANLREVRVHLAAGLMDRLQWSAAELELPARLQRNGGQPERVGESDDAAVVLDR